LFSKNPLIVNQQFTIDEKLQFLPLKHFLSKRPYNCILHSKLEASEPLVIQRLIYSGGRICREKEDKQGLRSSSKTNRNWTTLSPTGLEPHSRHYIMGIATQ
jgi:hypothetical protein